MNFEQLQKLSGFYTASRVLQVATDLKLFDVLASESRTAGGIADALKTDPRATELLLNALTGMELLEKRDSKFSNTEISQRYLVTSSPKYYGWIISHGSRLWSGWSDLEESIRTGKSPKSSTEREFTDEAMEDFIMGMHSIITARGDADLLSSRLDLEKVGSILDLGGGPATFSIVFCRNHENLKATVFDLPETIKIARKNLNKNEDVLNRITLTEGDFIKSDLPKGFDLIFISNIIHMLDEKGNQELMNKAFASLNPGGKIVIKDHILNEDLTLPSWGSIFSLNMLLHSNGRDYGYHEIEAWLKSCGCSKVSLLELPEDVHYGIVVGA